MTRGGRRAIAIREALSSAADVPMLVAILPAASGREGLRQLQQELEGAVAAPTPD